MTLHPELQRNIKTLRLSGILDTLPARLQQSVDGNVSHLQFLELLLQDELDRRKDRLLQRRTKSAHLNALWTLDVFDWSFNPKISKQKLLDLATTNFIFKKENAIFIGPPGTGKSHLAHAIGFAAIHATYLVASYPVYDITEMILEAEATGERKKLFEKLLKPDLLILDDLGMKRLSPEMAEDLLEIIMKRYEKKSTIMTSNRPIEDWAKILGDAATTSALLDRLMHHAHFISFQGRSYRLEKNTKKQNLKLDQKKKEG
jgi:DNA replication protein DnaC